METEVNKQPPLKRTPPRPPPPPPNHLFNATALLHSPPSSNPTNITIKQIAADPPVWFDNSSGRALGVGNLGPGHQSGRGPRIVLVDAGVIFREYRMVRLECFEDEGLGRGLVRGLSTNLGSL